MTYGGKPHLDLIKRQHAKRRKDGVCIANPRHGKAHRGGRCKACWDRKNKAQQISRILNPVTPAPEPGVLVYKRAGGKPKHWYEQWHWLVNERGHSACGRFLAIGEFAGRPPESIPLADRCAGPGCRQRWDYIDARPEQHAHG